jgi:hypothetical protein
VLENYTVAVVFRYRNTLQREIFCDFNPMEPVYWDEIDPDVGPLLDPVGLVTQLKEDPARVHVEFKVFPNAPYEMDKWGECIRPQWLNNGIRLPGFVRTWWPEEWQLED